MSLLTILQLKFVRKSKHSFEAKFSESNKNGKKTFGNCVANSTRASRSIGPQTNGFNFKKRISQMLQVYLKNSKTFKMIARK